MERSVKHKDELKLAVKRFVVLNLSQLLVDGVEEDQSAQIMVELIDGYVNEALEEFVTSVKSIQSEVNRG